MTSSLTALRLDRISLNVSDLSAATAFYAEALGFESSPAVDADARLAGLMGARSLRTVLLRRGQQRLELALVDPPGAPYPADSRSNDLWFQHARSLRTISPRLMLGSPGFPSRPSRKAARRRCPAASSPSNSATPTGIRLS